jgi:peroxiredoxin Q/BCP
MNIGDKAPDFTLKDLDGDKWSLREHLGRTVVLLFYPGDDTPVCTKQLCSVRDNWSDYQKTGAEVVGVSMDSPQSHKSFADKYSLTLKLLSDEAGEVVEKYQVKSWLPGRSARAVIVIDKNGLVAYHKVQSLSLFRPKDDEILAAIKSANSI